MRVKKSGGRVYGADLTAAERKGMELEIKREIAKANDMNAREIDAIFLWVLHKEFGFGVTRLRRFYDRFAPALKELNERYEMEESDQIWLATYKLKEELGIDLEQWEKETKA